MNRLAKQQACQLFIEQEIEKGLKDGKTKYAIGKEVAAWIKKFFEADVRPKSIEMRARRMAVVTNVTNQPTHENTSEKKEIQVPKPTHGGARVGAGRPTTYPPARMGMQFARHAIRYLEQIEEGDLERDQALDSVQDWINKNRRRTG
jgi:hypothetical protein